MAGQEERRGAPWRAMLACVCVAVFAVAAIVGLRQADSKALVYDEETLKWEKDVLSDVVYIGGVACVPKRNIRTYLFMGIDDTASQGENYVTGGQADMLMLLVVDQTSGEYRKLPINRNTMCKVRSYDIDGDDLGTVKCQIALAHATGDGGTLSCENTAEAVSNYLNGVKIDCYLALGIESISIVNHLVGGVTVTVEDDFSSVDDALTMGRTLTLSDKQAVEYVRNRMDVGHGTNEERMRRQDAYFNGVLERILERTREDIGYATDFYDTMTPHMVTNMNGKSFSRLIRALTDYEAQDTVTIAGTIGLDEFGFATFVPDSESKRDALITLFYNLADEEEA